MEFVTRGNRLHFRRWWVERALGVVVISHGLGEHSGRYRQLARDLNRSGYSVYALDHYGHGLSDGKRGHIDDFAHYSADLHNFIRLVKQDNPGCGLHLLGHSMGGVIATGCAVRHGGIDSLVLSAPGFRGATEPGGLELWLLQRLVKLLPSLALPNRLDIRGICRDEAVIAAYQADELVHDRVSLQWFSTFLREREFLYPRLSQITEPCLMLLPEGDRLVDVATSRAWFDRLGSRAKQLHVFPGAYHEVFNEVEEGVRARELLLQHLHSLLPTPVAAALT
ncbi:alpha/beta hydrolase [Microbulbifer marinus]|uniref:Lysophospholipase, alpha-beta hydrolase superfamily n=1 Tax=Microbulbifer marinus TaxID=658218 RepID=A0A1H4BNA6_9GAMM|nr:alpha/beta hydrolase [Microbulbifer marinus]SEA49643.1 Lysophospholipase, alpha-beta hydrolase superfamily [Microbulbifer marinus]